MPVRSGLPSAVRGAGAARFTLPSALRGRPGVLVVSHCAPADVADNTNPTARQIAFIRPQLSRTPERPSIPPLFTRPDGRSLEALPVVLREPPCTRTLQVRRR